MVWIGCNERTNHMHLLFRSNIRWLGDTGCTRIFCTCLWRRYWRYARINPRSSNFLWEQVGQTKVRHPHVRRVRPWIIMGQIRVMARASNWIELSKLKRRSDDRNAWWDGMQAWLTILMWPPGAALDVVHSRVCESWGPLAHRDIARDDGRKISSMFGAPVTADTWPCQFVSLPSDLPMTVIIWIVNQICVRCKHS